MNKFSLKRWVISVLRSNAVLYIIRLLLLYLLQCWQTHYKHIDRMKDKERRRRRASLCAHPPPLHHTTTPRPLLIKVERRCITRKAELALLSRILHTHIFAMINFFLTFALPPPGRRSSRGVRRTPEPQLLHPHPGGCSLWHSVPAQDPGQDREGPAPAVPLPSNLCCLVTRISGPSFSECQFWRFLNYGSSSTFASESGLFRRQEFASAFVVLSL